MPMDQSNESNSVMSDPNSISGSALTVHIYNHSYITREHRDDDMLYDVFIANCSFQKSKLQQYTFTVAAGALSLCLALMSDSFSV